MYFFVVQLFEMIFVHIYFIYSVCSYKSCYTFICIFLYCMVKTNEYRDVLVDSTMESGETYLLRRGTSARMQEPASY